MRLLTIILLAFQLLLAQNEKQISFLDFIELLSVHNNISVFVDENSTKEVSFFVPDDVKPQDYLEIFKMSMKKDGFDVLKKGDVYYLQKLHEQELNHYIIDLKYNSFEDVSKYLKFKKIEHEFSANRVFFNIFASQYLTTLKDIQRLDKPKNQLSLKFTILEISDSDIEDIGIDLTSSTLSGDVKSVLSAIISPQTSSNLVFQNNHFHSVLNLYGQNKKLNVVQNPFILVQDSKPFDFQAVTNIPYKTSETTTQSTINSENTKIEYKDVGLKINGIAYINNNFVNLDLNLSVEDILSIINDSPTTYKRALKSNSNLQYGQVLILSGIKQTKKKDIDLSVPFISNIPYLGEIFKYKSRNEEVSNISIAVELVGNEFLNSALLSP